MKQYHYKGYGVIVERNGRGFRSMIRPPQRREADPRAIVRRSSEEKGPANEE
jgi:hypothetical protein